MITIILMIAVAGSSDLGESIYVSGIPSKNVIACSSCHGQTGMGLKGYAPRLAGQDEVYLVKQMRDFATGARSNDAGSSMRYLAASMTEDEIRAVSNYLSTL